MNGKGSLDTAENKHPSVIYRLSICATLSGVLVGYDTGIINGAVILIEEQFHLTYFWVAALVASTILSAAVFSFLSGIIADVIGRKLTIMVSAIVFSVGGGIMGVASGVVMLLVGRFIVGACIGIVSSVVPVYVSECAPAEIRGRLITLNQLFITIGIMLSALLAACFQDYGEAGWRFMLGVSAIPGVAQFIFFFVLPESPRYQMMKGQDIKALNTLRRIRGTQDVFKEMEEIREAIREENGTKTVGKLEKMFQSPTVKKALFIGCMLQLFQQFSGINTVIYYSSTILKIAGFDRYQAIWLSCIPATINFLATFIGLWAVESTGRKLILALSFSAIAVALCVIGFGFIMNQLESPPASPSNEDYPQSDQCSKYNNCYECAHDRLCGYCAVQKDTSALEGACISSNVSDDRYATWGRCAYSSVSGSYASDKVFWEPVACPTVYSYFVLAGLVLFVLSFAPGAGPMPWTINAEIYPLWCRSRANSIATVTNWTCNLIVSYSFLTLKDTINMWGTFVLFSCVCLLATIFVFTMVPETKDKSLEEVELLFINRRDTVELEGRSSSAKDGRISRHSERKRSTSVTWLPTCRVTSGGSIELS